MDVMLLSLLEYFGEWLISLELHDNIHLAWFLFYTVSCWLYSVLMHGFWGQTIGKMLCGIKVIDISEKPITLFRAFLRDSVPIAIELLLVVYIIVNSGAYFSQYDCAGGLFFFG